MNKKQKICENLHEILSDSEPEPSGESLLNINREESEINLIFSQEDNEKNQEFVHQRCAARILNIAVQHGLQLSDPIIKKIPELKPDLDVET
ncbi:1048_t:CDS:2 [Entrophospora sp. SA101]|nr:1048_t:CDS:2 [Entrophospora sp. SA101]